MFGFKCHRGLFPMVEVIAWHRTSVKPLHGQMVAISLTQYGVTWPQWVNYWNQYQTFLQSKNKCYQRAYDSFSAKFHLPATPILTRNLLQNMLMLIMCGSNDIIRALFSKWTWRSRSGLLFWYPHVNHIPVTNLDIQCRKKIWIEIIP